MVYRDPERAGQPLEIFWQSVLGIGAALFIAFSAKSPAQTELIIPSSRPWPTAGHRRLHHLTYFVIVGTSNAVNLTDGLDGLAIMPTVMIAAAFALRLRHRPRGLCQIPADSLRAGAGELCIFLGAIAGPGLGFLWFNAYPAEVFMGDVGALALGARSAPSPSSSARKSCC